MKLSPSRFTFFPRDRKRKLIELPTAVRGPAAPSCKSCVHNTSCYGETTYHAVTPVCIGLFFRLMAKSHFSPSGYGALHCFIIILPKKLGVVYLKRHIRRKNKQLESDEDPLVTFFSMGRWELL